MQQPIPKHAPLKKLRRDWLDHMQNAEDARVAMELFDLAAELLERVRGPAITQARAARLRQLCTKARNAELKLYDAAIERASKSRTSAGTSN